jgi:hypothetical protein
MARKWTKRKIIAKMAEIKKMPAAVAIEERRALLLGLLEEASPAQWDWLVTQLMMAVLLPMSEPERHKFLNDLYKQSLN